MNILILLGSDENLLKIRKLGKWLERLYIILLLIVKCLIELKKILLIKVVEWFVIFVGCIILGWKKLEFGVLRKLLVVECDLNFKRFMLKFFMII